MKRIDAQGMRYEQLNGMIRAAAGMDVTVENCNGQRYIGCGLSGKAVTVYGTPGNGLGAYMDGAEVMVHGNAQDAAGDTMNAGKIAIHGDCGDTVGYAMRGGSIYIKGDAGYRAGIHMKAYKDKLPVLVIGGRAGSFLGEYQAGGVIVVLGIGCGGELPVGNFCGTGMHGGKIYLQCGDAPRNIAAQAVAERADAREVMPYLKEYCALFGGDAAELAAKPFYVLLPNTKNPYQQLYAYV